MANSFIPSSFMSQLNKIPLLDYDSLMVSVLQYKATGCKKSYDTCVTSFLRLVSRLSLERRGYAEADDVFQQGAIGVMDAIRTFDPQAGLNIVSWTKIHIARAINRHCLVSESLIKVPETKVILRCYRRMRDYLASGPITHARCQSLSSELGVSLDDFIAARDLYLSSYEPISHTGEEEEYTLQISGECTLEDVVFKEAEAVEVTNTIGRLMTVLNPKETAVIQMRCLGEEPIKLKDVGAALGFSTERARQVESIAMGKMRAAA